MRERDVDVDSKQLLVSSENQLALFTAETKGIALYVMGEKDYCLYWLGLVYISW